jgi:predicted nucleotidyltransferase
LDMRLTKKEIEAIREVTSEVFGDKAKAHLFGSRVNDALKGGDIDLLIQTDRNIPGAEQNRLKIKFLVHLKNRIGDQRIDVVLDRPSLRNSNFYKTICESMIRL